MLLQLLSSILKREQCHGAIPGAIEPLCLILSKSLTDSFPDVKRECVICIRVVAKASRESLRPHAATLAKAVVANLGHQHSKVRQSSIQALSVLIPCLGADGIEKLLEEPLMPALRKVVFDRTPNVRKELGSQFCSKLHRPQ